MGRKNNNYGGYRKDGDNTRYLEFLADLMLIPKIDLYNCTGADVRNHMLKYLEVTAKHDQRVSLANFALSLHISVPQLYRHFKHATKITEDVYDGLMEIYSVLNASLEDGMLSGTSNVVGSIFLAKNNFGYKDETQQLIVHEDRRLTAEELKAIAESLPPVVDADYSEITDKQIADKEGKSDDGNDD